MYTFTQQPSEVLDYDLDLSQYLPEGDTIATVSASVSPTGPDVSLTQYDNGKLLVKQWVGNGGVDGTDYKVTVVITSVGGRIKEWDFMIEIREV